MQKVLELCEIITRPAAEIRSVSKRRQVRLLAALLLVFLVLAVVRQIKNQLGLQIGVGPTLFETLLLVLVFGAGYGFSRSRRFRVGVWLLLIGIILAIVNLTFLTEPVVNTAYLNYLILPILLSSMFLEGSAPGIFTLVALGIILGTPLVAKDVAYSDILMGSFGLVVGVSGMGMVLAYYRVKLDDDNQKKMAQIIIEQTGELTQSNQQLKREILERQNAEEALAESRERYRLISEMTSDYAYAVRVAPDGQLTFEWMTEAMKRITGSEGEGLPFKQQLFDGVIFPADREMARKMFMQLLRNQPSTCEFRLVALGGDVRIVRHVGRPIWDAEAHRVVRVLGAAQDITNQKQAEEALYRIHDQLEQRIQERTAQLAEERSLLRTVIDNLPDQIVVRDVAGRIILSNLEEDPALADRDLVMRLGAALAERYRANSLSVIQSGKSLLENEAYWINAEGQPCWSMITQVPLKNVEGGVVGAVGIIHDITEIKRDEEVLRQRDALLEMVSHLAEALVKSPNWQETLLMVMQDLGEVTHSSRVYLYQNEYEHGDAADITCIEQAAWCSADGESHKRVARPKQISLKDYGLLRLKQAVVHHQMVRTLTQDLQPTEQVFFESMGVLSMLTLPIFVSNQWWGELNFEDCVNPRIWTDIEVEALGLAANILAAVIERAETERALRESEARFRSVAKSAKDAIISIDHQSRIIFWNDGAVDIFGYSVEEALNQKLDLITPSNYNLMHTIEMRRAVHQGNLKAERKVIEAQALRKDGAEFPAELSFASWKTTQGMFFTAIIRDVTERKRQDEALRRAYTQNKQMLASISSFLIGINADGIITHWNDTAAEQFNLPGIEIVGRNLYELSINWQLDVVRKTIEVCRETRKKARAPDVSWIRSDQQAAILGITVDPILEDEVVVGFLLLGADITHRKIMEQQLAQTHKMESIGQLAAGIAHEINTPTQFVSSNLRFLKGQWPALAQQLQRVMPHEMADREQIEYISREFPLAMDQSLEGMERIARIVSAMRNFSHPGSEKKSPADINRIIENTLIMTRNDWAKVAQIVTHLAPDLPLVACYPAELSQVLLNMIVNSIDAITERMEGKSLEFGQITLTTCCHENSIEIRITDNGGGIPVEIQDRIFDYFFTTKDVSKGTGQGLSIAHNIIVKKHGGSVRFETEANVGTTFIIQIPIDSAVA